MSTLSSFYLKIPYTDPVNGARSTSIASSKQIVDTFDMRDGTGVMIGDGSGLSAVLVFFVFGSGTLLIHGFFALTIRNFGVTFFNLASAGGTQVFTASILGV